LHARERIRKGELLKRQAFHDIVPGVIGEFYNLSLHIGYDFLSASNGRIPPGSREIYGVMRHAFSNSFSIALKSCE